MSFGSQRRSFFLLLGGAGKSASAERPTRFRGVGCRKSQTSREAQQTCEFSRSFHVIFPGLTCGGQLHFCDMN